MTTFETGSIEDIAQRLRLHAKIEDFCSVLVDTEQVKIGHLHDIDQNCRTIERKMNVEEYDDDDHLQSINKAPKVLEYVNHEDGEEHIRWHEKLQEATGSPTNLLDSCKLFSRDLPLKLASEVDHFDLLISYQYIIVEIK